MLSEGRPSLPFAAEIYDYELDELETVLKRIQTSMEKINSHTEQDAQWLEKATYIKQLVETEIKERQDVISFGDMCMNYKPQDNPFDFLKKFDDFNRQLQKLAQEEEQKTLILNQRKESTGQTSHTIKTIEHTKEDLSNFSQCLTEKSIPEKTIKVKRNSDTKEMMMKLLQRTQVSTKVVIGKSTQSKKAQNQKNTGKTIKTVTKQETLKQETPKQEVPKHETPKTIVMKKPTQLPPHPPVPQHKHHEAKPLSNKQLVQFVRHEEEEKKRPKEPKSIHALKSPSIQQIEEEIECDKSSVLTKQQSKTTIIVIEPKSKELDKEDKQQDKQYQNKQKQDNSKQKIKEIQILKNVHKKQGQVQELEKNNIVSIGRQISQPNIQNEKRQSTSQPIHVINQQKNVQHHLESKTSQKPNEQILHPPNTHHQTITNPQPDDIKQEIQEQSEGQDRSHRPFQLKGRLIKTASSQKSTISHQNTQKQFKLASPEDYAQMVKRVESSDDDEKPQNQQIIPQAVSRPMKDCYSEEYWQNVKRQAEQDLQNVKKINEQKKLQRALMNDQVNKAMAEIQQYREKAREIIEKQQEVKEESEIKVETKTEVKTEQIEVKTQPKVKKIKKPKKQQPVFPILNLPAHIEDYLCHFPSFHHLFSVYYLKPSSEAILDINLIMKELYAIFTIHKEVMDNNGYRKPLFTPFDNFNTVYINQPRQLLNHAQTTHVDIKNMIGRLSVFNQNIHGRFDDEKETMHYRVVKNREEVYDIVTTTFLRLKGWRELPHGMNLRTSWNLFWTWAKPELDLNKLLVFQKVNHFPLNKNLCRKDLLYKNMENFRKQFRVATPFLPVTYNLPKEFSQFSVKFHEDQIMEHQNNIWIMKPIGKSRGRGIKLVNNIADISYHDNIVVQKYIKNPLLLDGYKFDMRIYVLVTSVHPLEIFLYRQGFARLSTQKFSMSAESIKNTFIHLTNFAIQKNNREAAVNFEGGSKISLKTLQGKLESMGIAWNSIWQKMQDIIVKSLLACSMTMPKFPSAFQLFGYDIMINDQLDCFLIEVNSSPSLQRSYMIDEIIKQTLIDDIIQLLDAPNFDRNECCQIFTERLARKAPTTSRQDNIDIGRMLRFKPLRKVGEMPQKLGLFQRIFPEPRFQELEKLVEAKFNPNMRYLDA